MEKKYKIFIPVQFRPGIIQKNWNAENFPPGIYFYRLQTDSYSETKQLVLVK